MIAPVQYDDREGMLADGCQLNSEVSFKRLPTWLKEPSLAQALGREMASQLEDCQFGFVTEYEGFTLSDYDKKWNGKRRMSERAFDQI
jgi:hypothetical protein